MTTPENIRTVHTPGGNSKQETKGRFRQTDTDNPRSSKDPGIKLTIKVLQENLRSDSRAIQDRRHTAGREAIRACRLDHRRDREHSVINIDNQSKHNLSGADLIAQQGDRIRHAPPIKLKLIAAGEVHPLTPGVTTEQAPPAEQEATTEELHLLTQGLKAEHSKGHHKCN